MERDPSTLRSANWLDGIAGEVIAPSEATCLPDNNVIDFWVVSAALAPHAAAQVVAHAPLRPHRPVTIRIATDTPKAREQVVRRPRAFPQAVPVGCRQRPPDDRWTCPADADVDLRWQRLASAIEGEFCDMFLIEPDRRHLFCGRGEALRIVRVWPKTRVGHSFPHGAVGTLNWRRAQRVLEELAAEPAALQRTQYLASLRKSRREC